MKLILVSIILALLVWVYSVFQTPVVYICYTDIECETLYGGTLDNQYSDYEAYLLDVKEGEQE